MACVRSLKDNMMRTTVKDEVSGGVLSITMNLTKPATVYSIARYVQTIIDDVSALFLHAPTKR